MLWTVKAFPYLKYVSMSVRTNHCLFHVRKVYYNQLPPRSRPVCQRMVSYQPACGRLATWHCGSKISLYEEKCMLLNTWLAFNTAPHKYSVYRPFEQALWRKRLTDSHRKEHLIHLIIESILHSGIFLMGKIFSHSVFFLRSSLWISFINHHSYNFIHSMSLII